MKRNEPTIIRASSSATRCASPVTHHSSLIALIAIALTIGGCGTAPRRDTGSQPGIPGSAPQAPGRGGYSLDDGPGSHPPPDLDSIADAVPRWEPVQRAASRPYVVMGRKYTPMTALGYYKARGIASWYGRRYHGKQTSSGEPYDMYAMTAAHPTLPIPSYARVTNLANGKSVVVRVNDRGPFLDGRIIDLSYTAAYKLGLLKGGSALVEVESILPGTPPAVARRTGAASAVTTAAPPGAASFTNEPGENPDSGQAASHGLFLQLGAFASRDNAESYLAQIRAQVAWLADRLQVLMRGGYYRVHAGPYASPAQARDIAQRLGAVLGTKPMLVNW